MGGGFTLYEFGVQGLGFSLGYGGFEFRAFGRVLEFFLLRGVSGFMARGSRVLDKSTRFLLRLL